MRKDTFKGITVLIAEGGAYITNGDTFTDSVYLGINASESDWRDATAEEYAEWQEAQQSDELDELTAKEALSILTGETE